MVDVASSADAAPVAGPTDPTAVVTPAAAVTIAPPANSDAAAPAAPAAPAPTVAAAPCRLRVEDIAIGVVDARQQTVTEVFVAKPPEYAIYLAGDVVIQYADDPVAEQQQRQNLRPLASLRAEINALLRGWRQPAAYYWKLAYGLQLALDGDSAAALDALKTARTDLLGERSAAGRLEYLLWTVAAGIAMLIGLSILDKLYPFAARSSDIWLAGKAGLIGAGFSIALAIRNRSVGLDIDRLDNIVDATLRLGIGVISAGVLLLLLATGVVPNVKVGDATLSGGAMTWQMVLVVGFVAGFLERLVPSILDKRVGAMAEGATAGAPAAQAAPAQTAPGQAAPAASGAATGGGQTGGSGAS